MCSVGILRLYLSVWQTSTASWNKAAPAKTVPITINLTRGKEGERHREGAPLGYNLKTTYKSSSAVRLLNLTSQHGFATCVQRDTTAHTVYFQKTDFKLMVL